MQETTDATLTKSEKNRILRLIREFGPPVENFQWSEKKQKEPFFGSSSMYVVSVLEHRPTGHYCVFGAHCMTTFPGISKKVEESSHENDWGKKESLCGRWLVDLRDELEPPDLWASIGKERVLANVALSAPADGRPFTAAECGLVATKLDEIAANVLESRLFAVEEMALIEREFAYLKESAERLSRKDWLYVFLGGTVGLGMKLTLDSGRVKDLLGLAASMLESLSE